MFKLFKILSLIMQASRVFVGLNTPPIVPADSYLRCLVSLCVL